MGGSVKAPRIRSRNLVRYVQRKGEVKKERKVKMNVGGEMEGSVGGEMGEWRGIGECGRGDVRDEGER
jgi:hypothetical protein